MQDPRILTILLFRLAFLDHRCAKISPCPTLLEGSIGDGLQLEGFFGLANMSICVEERIDRELRKQLYRPGETWNDLLGLILNYNPFVPANGTNNHIST